MAEISGKVDPAFEPVREVFEANFADDAVWTEVGSGYTVYVDGKKVVELVGGVANQETGAPWTVDTLANVFSTTKALPSIAIAQLVEKGKVAYDDPVAKHWPEFAENGKEGITLAHVLSHTSGVNAFEVPMELADLADWEKSTLQLAKQKAICAPGEKSAYHALTQGHLAMEVVRRVTGLMPAAYINEYITGPIDSDFNTGVAQTNWHRVSKLIPPPPPPADLPKPDPQAAKAIMNPSINPAKTETPVWRNAHIPAANGHATASGVARLWAAIANDGELEGVKILSRPTIDAMRAVRNNGPDMLLGPIVMGAGVIINAGKTFGPNPEAFGNCGMGGSAGFADLDLKLAAGYVPNRLFPNLLQDPRAMALHNAAVDCATAAGA